MQIGELLTTERILSGADIHSKKRALEALSELLAQGGQVSSHEVFDTLLARERLGSTGLGHGVAIPHGRMTGLKETQAAFIKLSGGIDFDAPDQQPVDLLFALLVPEDSASEHLETLSRLAQLFSDPVAVQQLRTADGSEATLGLLSDWEARHAA
ncbi:PTS IIA-like nitrogen regulatory protein PtsN [Acidihalobacter prosperus]|uniref:PTS IIA-like nitrogen-regulatory protein PtsN n=1 Tax=Acidihalobacter prosperus TaxID=160660 RepID=A0A1A6C3I0_9GAMM|nr:PTS IIA-like nitrogen regulatory protein PtsN [Acidihalobacter prosperus]OBS09114.1 PTS IIA-like nitrogen-regulatory protein PtsN [Acidihalobacter prosperus]